jgi:AraC family transcriptional regulator of adaptative response/methylated-DNA-[protein]-cysteine methyltransferase
MTERETMTGQMTLRLPIEDDPRWAQILARDPAADGRFWYSVATTGVYCRPTCPSRRANAENVAIHDTLEEARATGFRPCRRCRPEEASPETARAALVAHACRRLEASEEPMPLAELARPSGLSPGRFHRLFKSVTGVTPRGYVAACRAQRVGAALGRGDSVTRAFHDAGYGSSGRFYEVSNEVLGMAPGRFRAGGPSETLRFAVGACSLGNVLTASSERGIATIMLGDDPDELIRALHDRFPYAELIGDDPDYQAVVAQVVGLVEAPGLGLDLPLDIRGTAFQQRVWQALRAIPPGETASYTEIAERIGAPSATRAVAGACAANAIAVAIPCHRVVRSDGSLSGYRWGVERKRALIEREAAAGRVNRQGS